MSKRLDDKTKAEAEQLICIGILMQEMSSFSRTFLRLPPTCTRNRAKILVDTSWTEKRIKKSVVFLEHYQLDTEASHLIALYNSVRKKAYYEPIKF